MKKIVTLLASMALIAAGLQIVPASAAPAPTDVKFFLGSTGCSADDVNFDFLTTTDSDAEVECFYTASGFRYEIGEQTGTVEVPTPAGTQRPLASREDATRYFDSIDGGPIALDAGRPVTGALFTTGGECPAAGACSPVGGLSAGEVIIDITLVGKSGSEEIELGAQTVTFEAAPGDIVKTDVNIQPDAALTGKVFETVELRTWIHGKSAGHGVIKTNGEYSSFISVPTATAGNSGKTPPGKNPVPGKKKGCDNGKGKKRGCEGKGKKSPKPGKPSAKCAPFAPGEAGAEKPTVVLTDAATEAAPVEQKVTLDTSVGDADAVGAGGELGGLPAPAGPGLDYFNVQLDARAADAGLYVLFEFPERRDYDLNLLHPDGSYAARSHGMNLMIPEGRPTEMTNEAGHGGVSTTSSESLVGIRTAPCGGWTLETANWLGEGGEMTVKLWLGEIQNDPQEAGAETP